MKKAAGEANLTVIAIILIGVVTALGLVVVPNLMKKAPEKACCTNNAGIWSDNQCISVSGVDFDISSYDECIKKQ